MKRLLFLAHRIPYPPEKGDKIRSFHVLKHLCARFPVRLGAFVDDARDWCHARALEGLCEEVRLFGLSPAWRRLRSLWGFARGEALSLPYYRDRAMAAWVRAQLRRGDVGQVYAFSSTMAQYILGPEFRGLRRVLDMVDVDSEKWRAYGERRPFPLGWLYTREARRLLAFEERAARECDATLFVSAAETALFRCRAPRAAARVLTVPNGVDTDFFSPQRHYPDPYGGAEAVLVFTGAMDYWANVDAVVWFAREVLPRVREQVRQARFCIVGARPAARVRALAALPGVTVTGAVPDVRPYLQFAAAAVAPLRVARGIQNKVLEALAMGKPVVATSAAMQGIGPEGELQRFVSDTPEGLAALAAKLLREGVPPDLGERCRRFVQARFSWERSLALLDQVFGREEGAARPVPPAWARA